jgi:hypothetical protein
VDSKGRKILVLEQIPSELADGMGAGGAFKSALFAFLVISPPAPVSSVYQRLSAQGNSCLGTTVWFSLWR